MSENVTKLVIDAGNTRIKVGVFQQDDLVDLQIFNNDELAELKTFLLEKKRCPCLISSVRSPKDTQWLKQMFDHVWLFSEFYRDILEIDYETPHTLGMDRLANAKAAYALTKHACLIVDIGTCIKFDFVDADGVYKGGSISPGIRLRYKSMNDYTANLPLLDLKEATPLIGRSTNLCMQSGVINGMQAEIDQFILLYRQEYPNLSVYVTGGDSQYFDFTLKNNIFVNKNLSLWGLYITLVSYAK